MTTFDEILARAKLPETSVSVCLRGDLDAEWRLLDRKMQSASRDVASLGDRSEASILAEQIRALEAEMASSQATFRFRAFAAKPWSDYLETKPRKADGEEDGAFNQRWFVWMCGLVSRCAIDPEMTPEQVAELCDVLSGGQWDELAGAAWGLNANSVAVPFSLAASATTPNGAQS